MKELLIGKFIKPFGVKGAVIVDFYIDDEEELQAFSAFYIKDKLAPGGMRSVGMELRPHGGRYVATMDEVTTPEQAELFREREIFVDEAELPEADKDSYYIKDLLGAKVNFNGNIIGDIKNVFNFGNGDLLLVRMTDGKEIAIPFKDEYVESVDVGESLVVVRGIEPLL